MKTFLIFLFGLIWTHCASSQTVEPAWLSTYDTKRPSGPGYIVSKGNKMGVITAKGELLTRFEYDTIYNFKEGMAIVGNGGRRVNQYGSVYDHRKYGFINSQGRLVIPIQWDNPEPFSEGLTDLRDHKNVYWFDKEGRKIFSFSAAGYGSFEGGTAYIAVSHQGMYYTPDYPGQKNPEDIRDNYINHAGHLLIPSIYDTIAPYQRGILRLVAKNGRYGFLDSTAQLTVPMAYEDARTPLDSVALVKKNGQWGGVSYHNQVVIPFQFSDALAFNSAGLAVVQQKGKYGLINRQGHLAAPFIYDTLADFHEGRALMRKEGRYGYLDSTGREIILPRFGQAVSFKAGKARTATTFWKGEINVSGNWENRALKLGWAWIVVALVALGAFGFYLRQKGKFEGET